MAGQKCNVTTLGAQTIRHGPRSGGTALSGAISKGSQSQSSISSEGRRSEETPYPRSTASGFHICRILQRCTEAPHRCAQGALGPPGRRRAVFSGGMIRTLSSTASEMSLQRSCPPGRRRFLRRCQTVRLCRSGAPDLRRPPCCKGRDVRA